MPERFVIRDEPFGSTVFDRKKLRHKYLEIPQFGEDIFMSGVRVVCPEHWPADLTSAPRDILYSPVRVYFETTRECNLRCRHCFNASAKKDSDEMTTGEIFSALEGMRQDNILDVRFTGGEFTVHPDWYEILKRAMDLGFGVSMNTNGVYDDPSKIDKIAELGMSQVTVSVEGLRPYHDQIRGKGSFDRTMEALQALHERGATLRTNTVLTKGNAQSMEDVIQTVGPYVDEMNFFHMRVTGRAQGMLDKALSYEELYKFNQQAVQIVRRYPEINILYGSQATRENSIRTDKLGLRLGGPDGFTRFNLLANGSMWTGGYVPYIDKSLEMGNIKDEGYTTLRVWRGPKIDSFREFSRQLLLRCFNCEELDVRCPGMNVEMELVRQKIPELGNPYCISDQPLPSYPQTH